MNSTTAASIHAFDWTAPHSSEEWAAHAAALRENAHREDREARESFERCDTDGFLSQWAKGRLANRDRVQAAYADTEGLAEILCLFRDGVAVPTKQVDGRFGLSWAVLADWDENARVVEWVSMSHASTKSRERAHYTRKGYTLGEIRVRVDFWKRTGDVRFRLDLGVEVVSTDVLLED